MADQIFRKFLGTWALDPASCCYEQGPPPRSAIYHIAQEHDDIVFTMSWVDADGEEHKMSFRGPPDGRHVPFEGGQMADAMSIDAFSERELNTSAYLNRLELMVAERILSEDGATMEIRQRVMLADGTRPTNTSTYVRA